MPWLSPRKSKKSEEPPHEQAPEDSSDDVPKERNSFLEALKFFGGMAATVLVTGMVVEKSKAFLGKLTTRGKYVNVTVYEGDSLGSLVTKYVGDYTDENLKKILKINKKQLQDGDLLQPGTVLRIPDNRKTELATAEKDWWKRRARKSGKTVSPTKSAEPVVDTEDLNKDFEKLQKEEKKALKFPWQKKAEPIKEEPLPPMVKGDVQLLQDRW